MSPRFGGLHVLADDDPRWGGDPVAQGRAACRGGAAVVQLRAKTAPDARALAWGRALRELTRQHGVLLVVNDRFDLALAVEADAVHLGQDDLPPDALPASLRGSLAVGRSTHTLEQARRAAGEPVDYVAFGPVFGTTSKESAWAAPGLGALEEAARAVTPLPLVAIGGIDAERLPAVLRAGAAGAAVISAVAGASEPEDAARKLAGAFRRSGG